MLRKIWVGALLLSALLAPAPPAAADVVSAGDLAIDLYISFEVEKQLESEGLGDPNGSFDADQVDIVFNYTRDRFRIAVDTVIEHGVATEDDRGNFELSFGFAEWAASPRLRLRAGKVLSPYGIHNELNSYKSGFLTVKLPLATNKPEKLTGQGFRFFPRRQVGVAVLGSVPLSGGDATLDYDVIIGNGEQEDTNPYEEDNNSQKSVTARVVYEPALGFGVGLSSYHDTLSGDGGDIDLTSLGAHLQYKGEKFQVWAEIDRGRLDHPGALPDVDQLGGFIEVGYALTNGLVPYLQFQYVDAKSDLADESARLLIGGIFYRFEKYAVVKLENAYHKGSRENSRFADLPGREYNELRAAVVLGF